MMQTFYTPEEVELLRAQIKRGVADAKAELQRRGGPGVNWRIVRMRIEQRERFVGTAVVRKRNKRLEIVCVETDELLYSLPSFIQVNDRTGMEGLAAEFNQLGRCSIDAIMAFETACRPDRRRSRRRYLQA